MATEPKKLLHDGQPWNDFSYDKAIGWIMVKSGGDPRLYVFETVVREQAIDLAGKKDVKIEDIQVVDTQQAGAANPCYNKFTCCFLCVIFTTLVL